MVAVKTIAVSSNSGLSHLLLYRVLCPLKCLLPVPSSSRLANIISGLNSSWKGELIPMRKASLSREILVRRDVFFIFNFENPRFFLKIENFKIWQLFFHETIEVFHRDNESFGSKYFRKAYKAHQNSLVNIIFSSMMGWATKKNTWKTNNTIFFVSIGSKKFPNSLLLCLTCSFIIAFFLTFQVLKNILTQ